MQNAIKLENISSLITSPSRKTMLVHFVIHGRHTLIGMYVCVLIFKTNEKKKNLVTEL